MAISLEIVDIAYLKIDIFPVDLEMKCVVCSSANLGNSTM